MTAFARALPEHVTVAILNHRRPGVLARILKEVARIKEPTVEIVVVGDQASIRSHDLPDWLLSRIRYVSFGEPNISRARNHAIRAATGEIIAFIDDDSLPERDWLAQLLRPFENPNTGTVGGCVLCGNGSWPEWQGGEFDRTGQEHALQTGAVFVRRSATEQVATGNYLSIRGTNCAFRRSALMQVGGFDEAICYYLDETDIALRIAHAGWSAAFVPRAQVRHLRLPNTTRSSHRKPGNLHEIAASKSFFVNRHHGPDAQPVLLNFKRQRMAMLDPLMRLGIVRTADRDRVERQLDAGIADGLARTSLRPLRPPKWKPEAADEVTSPRMPAAIAAARTLQPGSSSTQQTGF